MQSIIGGLQINYNITGHGPDVLVLHGWGIGSASWEEFAKMLAKRGFRVITIDLPGFGKSSEPPKPWFVQNYVDFMYAFLDALKINKITLLGHSFGGGLAAAFITHNPGIVEKLILVDAAVIREERFDIRQHIARALAKGKTIMAKFPVFDKLYPLGQKIVYKIAGVHDYQKASALMKETFKNVNGQDLSACASFVRIPSLIIWGECDKSTPVQDAFRLNKLIDGSVLKIIPGCGHNPHQTHTKELVAITSEFIKQKS